MEIAAGVAEKPADSWTPARGLSWFRRSEIQDGGGGLWTWKTHIRYHPQLNREKVSSFRIHKRLQYSRLWRYNGV